MAIKTAFIQKTLKKNLKLFGDAYIDCTYISNDNDSAGYDPETSIISEDVTTINIKAIVADFSFDKNQAGFMEIENSNILSRDKKAIVESRFFGLIKPQKDDEFVDLSTSITYFVVGVNEDPFKSVYLMHLRPAED